MIECFEQFFQVEESFLKERDKQTELMCRHIPNMDKKTTTIQFLFIRENWEDYEKANNYSHENNLEPVKFNEPPNFSHWTYGQLVEQLVCAITKTSGKLTRSLREAGSSDESLDSAGGEGNGHTFMLVERLTCDKHVIRILPFAHKVDPTLLPMCVLMECSMFLVGFQMLAMLTCEGETERGDSRKTREFEVDHVRLKWNRKEQKPLKSEKRFHAVPMHLTVKVNLARLNRKGSSEMKQLCLSDFQLYFGALSSKSGGILKDKPKDAKLWKKSLSLIGDNYCHILTFRDTSTMMSCFWSLQHAKLGGSGVDEWIPRHRLDNIPRRSRITNPVTSGYMPLINSREQRLSTGSAASHGSLGQASYLGNGGNHSSPADTASATEHGVGGGEGGNGRRTGGMSAQSVISNRLSRSVDMLQEPLTSLPVHLQETPGFVGKDKRSSSSRLTMALKKRLSSKRERAVTNS
ncbi:uncharacterized protein LOC134846065 isoform X2 [Symsagittifera roscoffensis]|uniref:uncharacterized protein LOC134846065 isoform X2 n=1 Tax=Symsagittifera roscoffensis TaxID=84072 RepID=UPI00307C29E6